MLLLLRWWVLLWSAVVLAGGLQQTLKPPQEAAAFRLQHVLHHGANRYPKLLKRLDVHHGSILARDDGQLSLISEKRQLVQRLAKRGKRDVDAYFQVQRSLRAQSMAVDWTRDEIRAPDIGDIETIHAFAQISSNAYIEIPGAEDWYDLTPQPYNTTDGFGWEDDGLRGHVYTDRTNKTVIIGVKGTSASFFDNSPTGGNDKVNDNLLFSCCCARVSYLWQTVCDCYSGTYSCNQTCLEKSLAKEDRYYLAAINLYYNVSAMYPDSDIWMSGHSLGGAMASLVGITFGLPTITFEAPGDRLAAQRLHLPLPPGMPANESAIWHFGHTADPIYMGVCNGPTSSCWLGGYAMETTCKSGLECTWDTVTDKGWRVSLTNHRINFVISDVIRDYGKPPKCEALPLCVDCFNWNFVDNSTHAEPKPTTSSTSPSKHTMTSASSRPSTTNPGSKPVKKCKHRNFIGWCKHWQDA